MRWKLDEYLVLLSLPGFSICYNKLNDFALYYPISDNSLAGSRIFFWKQYWNYRNAYSQVNGLFPLNFAESYPINIFLFVTVVPSGSGKGLNQIILWSLPLICYCWWMRILLFQKCYGDISHLSQWNFWPFEYILYHKRITAFFAPIDLVLKQNSLPVEEISSPWTTHGIVIRRTLAGLINEIQPSQII